ncbi:hypothetical protein LP419_04605 [Massilia sp. H-1]|nr:hypothetical protein LP419_04605 [Massilia sp. H-1]
MALEAKKSLKRMRKTLSDGTAARGLEWVAGWLLQTNPHSRYGEVNFEIFEREAGKQIADSVRLGLSQVWRKQAPRFDEQQPRTTYHIAAAGLQGLHLDLGLGDNLPSLTDAEIRRALHYGTFEINGYPKWFWPLVEAHPVIAASELQLIASEAPNGPVSTEHAEELFTSLAQAPTVIRESLSPSAWAYLANAGPSHEYVSDKILQTVMSFPGAISRADFGRITMSKLEASLQRTAAR